MLNVIALRPAEKNQLEKQTTKLPANSTRHHVLKGLKQENSGRLSCSDEMDVEVPPTEIYAAR